MMSNIMQHDVKAQNELQEELGRSSAHHCVMDIDKLRKGMIKNVNKRKTSFEYLQTVVSPQMVDCKRSKLISSSPEVSTVTPTVGRSRPSS